ncbi:hypothetical protein HMPREF1432_01081 [Helicobacter pylori GAMchJs114i]|uniref:hypothetical protein n=1 Tax=Helicobacter pylori TaxID=210 RepID=UPI0002BC395B|nr:hypothetical protein [Helicobacter pylori]EMG83393.1 hypothetical protein HMPREF1392_00660 [Helicobacter pylori GAM101Biv]EMJ40462.1 hypothetical protein HMPREF1432_01081 [Helicobacter pylori GAMchJs114i]
MARGWGFAFFLLKCTRKIRLRHAKMKDIYLGVEKSIEDLQNIFKNADDRDEKHFRQTLHGL